MISEIDKRHRKKEPDREKRRLTIPAFRIAAILNEESGDKIHAIAILNTAIKCLSPRFSLVELHFGHTLEDESRIDENSK
jgi:hypothetical protein